ncbi:jg24416, partial [Pararge aegeria aegeria]
ATALWGVLDVSLGQWQRYRENPTVVTLEKNFRTWHYIMPGITACEQNRTTEEKVQKAIKSRWNAVPGDDKFSYYGRFVDLVANSDLHHLEGYKEFANDTDLNVDLFQLAIDVMPEQRVKLSAADQITTLPKWIPVMTEVGACYAINSLALTDVAIVKPTSNETSGIPNSCKYSSQGCFYIFEYANLINGQGAADVPRCDRLHGTASPHEVHPEHRFPLPGSCWAKGPLMYRGVIGFTVQPPRMRYTRNIVFHFQDLVVSFGGATGLFLGASFISFVEIGYFVIERILRTGADKPKIAV